MPSYTMFTPFCRFIVGAAWDAADVYRLSIHATCLTTSVSHVHSLFTLGIKLYDAFSASLHGDDHAYAIYSGLY